MVLKMFREGTEPLQLEGVSLERLKFIVDNMVLRDYDKKDFIRVTLDGEDVTGEFSKYIQPCPCGNFGSRDSFCWCSSESIHMWRIAHGLKV